MPQIIEGPAMGPDLSYPQWVFKLDGVLRPWHWVDGSPPLTRLEPCRMLIARALARHLPASPYSTTTSTLLSVESGLEADLVRELDRDPQVRWIVPQPAQLLWPDRTKHIPDMLTEGADGAVTVWDVRPVERQNERFRRVAEMTETACRRVGWQYRLFSDEHPERRLNLQWLTHYRRIPAGTGSIIEDIVAQVRYRPQSIDELAGDEATAPDRLRAIWHLVWSGRLACDLNTPLTGNSVLTLPMTA